MFRHFYNKYFNPKYRLALRDAKGKSIYAGYCMDAVESKTSKKGSKIRENIKALYERKKNFKNKLQEILKHPILENDEYYSTRKKIRLQRFLFWIMVIAESALNYFTTLIFMPQNGIVFFILRLIIAVIVTVVAISAVEKLLEESFPKDKKRNIPMLIFWLITIIGFEYAIYNLGIVRSGDFEGGNANNSITTALILISMILPIVAGGIRWDMLNHFDTYDNRRKHDKLTKKFNAVDTKLEILQERENTYFQRECGNYWHTLNVFCTHKNRYNIDNSIQEETLDNHKYAKDIDSWKEEAEKRYRAKIKKTDFARVATKLDSIEPKFSKKLS